MPDIMRGISIAIGDTGTLASKGMICLANEQLV
jgi:hypothetical protein